MTQYDAVIIDEVSMITEDHFARIVRMWLAAGKVPLLLLLGDFWQLPGPFKEPQVLTAMKEWDDHVNTVKFSESVRCKDPALLEKVRCLRTAVPSKKQLRNILRGHRAWKSGDPTAYDILDVLRRTDYRTTVITCTRRAASLVSDLAVQVLFRDRGKTALGTAALTWEANLENYDEHGAVRERASVTKNGILGTHASFGSTRSNPPVVRRFVPPREK